MDQSQAMELYYIILHWWKNLILISLWLMIAFDDNETCFSRKETLLHIITLSKQKPFTLMVQQSE